MMYIIVHNKISKETIQNELKILFINKFFSTEINLSRNPVCEIHALLSDETKPWPRLLRRFNIRTTAG